MTHRTHTSAEPLRIVIEASPIAIIAIDRSERVTLWNSAAARMFGYHAEEILFRPLRIPPDRRGEFERALAELASGRTPRLEIQAATRDNRQIDVSVTGAAVRDSEGQLEGFMALMEDVTDRKQPATALTASQAQLAQAQKMEAIGTLAGGVAHDFNNLLTVIRSYSAMLVEDLPVTDTENRQYAGEILAAADRAAALTRQLLTFSRQHVVQPRLVSADDVVRGVEMFLRRLLPPNISLNLSLCAGDAMIRIDPGQLEQVLMNLVINASHAMPRGGRIDVRTDHVVLSDPQTTMTGELDPGAYLALTVRDTGVGMDDAVLGHLFEPFFTTKLAGTGTGLGLSIVRGIVADQGGGISVDTAVGRGTSFRVMLPISPESAEHTSESPAQVPTGDEVILVVEDDEAVRNAVRLALERYGYTVLDAPDGAHALLVASMFKSPPDLVLTDLMMPEVGGRELVKQLRKGGLAPRVLLMSGYVDDAASPAGLAVARYPFIQKPFTREALAQKVREVLDAAPEPPARSGGSR